jgi:hypothetical protein
VGTASRKVRGRGSSAAPTPVSPPPASRRRKRECSLHPPGERGKPYLQNDRLLMPKTSNECVRGIVSPAAASLHSCQEVPPSSLIRIFLPGDCGITNIAASNCTASMLPDCQLWRGLGGQQRSREARKFASTHIGSVQQLLLLVAR